MSETNIITWGTNAGMTIEQIFQENIGWCLWTRDRHEKSPLARSIIFCDWLDSKLQELDNSLIIPPSINVSHLAKIIDRSPSFLKLLNGCSPVHSFFSNQIKWSRPAQVPPNLFGVFIDYVLRHYISSQIGQPFIDRRAEIFAVDLDDSENDCDFVFCKENGNPIRPKRVCVSYKVVKQSTETKLVLRELFYTSTAHTAFWGEGYHEKIDYDDSFLPLQVFDIITQNLEIVIKKTPLLLNPIVGNANLGINGDADLITGEEIIDFKTSMNEPATKDFIQLYLYAVLYYKNTGKYIKTLTVLNPLMMCNWTIDISNWNGYEEVIDWINKRKK